MQNEPKTERPTIGSSGSPANYNGNVGGKKGSNTIWLVAAAVLSVLILTLAFLNFQKYDVFTNETASGDPQTTSAEDNVEAAAPSGEQAAPAADGFPDSADLQSAAQGPGGPWVVGLQQDFQYRISGVVPSEEAKTAISTAVTEAYSDNPSLVLNEITVDTSLTPAPWLDSVPTYIKVLPLELIEGSFSVNGERTALAGIAPAQTFVDNMETAASDGNLPPFESTVTIGEGRPPTITASSTGGKLEMLGTVPSQRLVDTIGEDATRLWGEGNVSNNLAVDETTFARFPVILFGRGSLGAFQPLGDFDIKLEQGQLSATVDGGVLFDPGSSQISAQVESDLQRFPAFLNQFERPVLIYGHTDNTGLPADNQILSQERADAAKSFFVDQGVSADRITAEGKGQDEPTASNDTAEGREKNRRVEIILGNT